MYTPNSQVIETCYVVTTLNRFGEVSTGFWHNPDALRSSLIWYADSYTFKGAAISIMRLKTYIFWPASKYCEGTKDITNVHPEYIDPVALRERGEEVVLFTHHEKPTTTVSRIVDTDDGERVFPKTYGVLDVNPEHVEKLNARKAEASNA